MHQSKMGFVEDMVEVVIVVVHLWGRKLSLVHNVFGGERAHVEPFREGTINTIGGKRRESDTCS